MITFIIIVLSIILLLSLFIGSVQDDSDTVSKLSIGIFIISLFSLAIIATNYGLIEPTLSQNRIKFLIKNNIIEYKMTTNYKSKLFYKKTNIKYIIKE